ncbi:MAG: STAS domain-containing protein [Herpetosiphonaceae bacterium]|nr:STAS domain-containing protein [Herpetosiphonaceae bacterium]
MYTTTIPVGDGTLRDFVSTVYQVEWTPEHAVALSIARDVTEQNQAMAALREANDSLAAQGRLIEELSVPVVTLWDGVLSAPIVGAVDSHRSSRLTEALLTAITRQRAAFAIIDITGVPIVDTQVANYLIQMMQAATLLGCQCLLVGIGPEIAQTVVQLGLDLSAIRTAPTMQRGLEIALMSLGYRVQRPGKGG